MSLSPYIVSELYMETIYGNNGNNVFLYMEDTIYGNNGNNVFQRLYMEIMHFPLYLYDIWKEREMHMERT